MTDDKYKLQAELLEALAAAKKRVESLQTELTRNAALLGIAVEGEEGAAHTPADQAKRERKILARYGLIDNQGDDLSPYIGREGDEDSRPKLGVDAPDEVRPDKAPRLHSMIDKLVLAHPDDVISFGADAFTDPPAPDRPSAEESERPQSATSTIMPVSASGIPEKAAHYLVSPMTQSMEGIGSIDSARAYLALQAVDDGIWDWDIRNGFVYCSSRWSAITGMSHDSVQPALQRLREIFEPDDGRLSIERLFKDLMNGVSSRVETAVRIKRKHAPDGWGNLRAICLHDAIGKPIRIVAVLADTTQQHEAAQALHASEEKFRALTELSHDIVVRFDKEGRFLYVSPSVSRYFPFNHEQLVGKSIRSLFFGSRAEQFIENLQWVFNLGLPVQTEFTSMSPFMGEFIAECRYWPEFGPDGEVVSVTTQIRDMTASRRAAENYRALFTRMADGFALFEHVVRIEESGKHEQQPDSFTAYDFVMVAANPAFARMMDIQEERTVGFRLADFLKADADLFVQHCLQPVIREGRSILASFRSPERGRMFEVSAYSPESGRVACIVKDVTAIHDIAEEVRLNEARFAALYRLSHMDEAPEEEVIQFSLEQAVQLTGSSIGYFQVVHGHNAGGPKTYWSQTVIDRYGHKPLPEFPDLSPESHTHSDSTPLRRAEIINGEDDRIMAHFSPDLPVHRYIIAPVIEDGRVVSVAGVANKNLEYGEADVRQLELFINGMWFQLRRRWSLQSLKAAKDEAEAASRAKNEFLANVSHELRTPLNGMLGMLQLLQQTHLTPVQMEYVVTANYSGRSLLRIISDILDFSRIEAGRLVLEPQVFDLAATLRSTLGMFVHQAEQKSLRFSLRIANDLPKFLLGDDARVRQIIFNIVGNAFKFTERGEIIVECSLLPRRQGTKHCIYFAVKDTGIGIPDERIDDIFRAFTQLDGSSTRKYAGTGLGLGIVQRLIQLMHGSLSVESEVGKGTTIHCMLPFDAPDKAVIEGSRPHEEAAQAPPLDILVAEDDPVNRLTIRSLLLKGGHKVTCVNNGRQAIEALLLHPFQCLVTDIQMPVMDGVEVVSRIREGRTSDIEPSGFVCGILGKEPEGLILHPIPQDLLIVALTAHAMSGDKEHFLSVGMDYYLAKPILAKEMHAILGQVSIILKGRGQLPDT